MSWGSRHQVLIVGGIIIVLVFIVALIAIPTFYRAPSCTDGKQNQKEDGIDCGGPCTYLCYALLDEVKPRFTRAILNSSSLVDVVSYIDNPNANEAARGVEYTVELFNSNGTLIGTKNGVMDIPSAATVPVFIPNIYVGANVVANTFLSIATTSVHWYTYRDTRVVLKAQNIRLDTSSTMPRVFATLENPSADVLTNVKVIATVFDASNTAIAASQTVLPVIPPQGRMEAVFTWNVPFSSTPSRIDILPIIPLPRP